MLSSILTHQLHAAWPCVHRTLRMPMVQLDLILWPEPRLRPSRLTYSESGRRIGECHHRAKLTDAQIDSMFQMLEEGLSFRKIAHRMGISFWTARSIFRGRTRGAAIYKVKNV